jgi:hypothetical protein
MRRRALPGRRAFCGFRMGFSTLHPERSGRVFTFKQGNPAPFQHINSAYYCYCNKYIQIQEKESARCEKLWLF